MNAKQQHPLAQGDYDTLLQHAVAAIEQARLEVARSVNGHVASAYWEIGKLLHERKIEVATVTVWSNSCPQTSRNTSPAWAFRRAIYGIC